MFASKAHRAVRVVAVAAAPQGPNVAPAIATPITAPRMPYSAPSKLCPHVVHLRSRTVRVSKNLLQAGQREANA